MPRLIAIFTTWLVLAIGAHAEDRASWFKSLIQPGTGFNCCDVADCGEAQALFRRGQWWVTRVTGRKPPDFIDPFTIYDGPALPVNPNNVLTDPLSIDGRAYACVVFSGIRCFVPPAMGS